MSNRNDPAQVLRHLADTLDIKQTLDAFPGMTREALANILRSVTDTGTDAEADAMPETMPETTTEAVASTGASTGQNRWSSAVLSVDGAARGNPGHAGVGIVLQAADGSLQRFGDYLGEATNNVAEYMALIVGMQKANELGVRELRVRSDSELIVKQLNGQYKVKSPHLQDLYATAIKEISSFDKVKIMHVRREENKEADKMANLAVDARGKVVL